MCIRDSSTPVSIGKTRDMWCPRDFAREYPSPVVPNCGAALPPDAMSTFDAFVVQSLPFFVSLNVTENEPLSLTIFSAAADVMI